MFFFCFGCSGNMLLLCFAGEGALKVTTLCLTVRIESYVVYILASNNHLMRIRSLSMGKIRYIYAGSYISYINRICICSLYILIEYSDTIYRI